MREHEAAMREHGRNERVPAAAMREHGPPERRPLPSSQLANAHSQSEQEEWERYERHRAREMHKRQMRAAFENDSHRRSGYYPGAAALRNFMRTSNA